MYFLQLLEECWGQECFQDPQLKISSIMLMNLSGLERNQESRNTQKKEALYDQFSCSIAEINLFKPPQRVSFQPAIISFFVSEPTQPGSAALVSWSVHHYSNFTHQHFQNVVFKLLLHRKIWNTTLCSQIYVMYYFSFWTCVSCSHLRERYLTEWGTPVLSWCAYSFTVIQMMLGLTWSSIF